MMSRLGDFLAEVARGKPGDGSSYVYGTVVSAGDLSEVLLDGAPTTLPCLHTVEAHVNHRVRVEIGPDGLPVIVDNYTKVAVNQESFADVQDAAEQAAGLLDTIADIEEAADDTLRNILEDAVEAGQGVEQVKQYVGYSASAAKTLAERVAESEQDVTAIEDYLGDASQLTDTIANLVVEASRDAAAAESAATAANGHATDALVQLGVVQDVAGTLDWISKHGTFVATADTVPQDGTIYFERSGSAEPYTYTPLTIYAYYESTEDASPQPGKTYYVYDVAAAVYDTFSASTFEDGATYYERLSPAAKGWYVLDTTVSQSNYIMAHIAVTSAGLWILPGGLYKPTSDTSAQSGTAYYSYSASTGAYTRVASPSGNPKTQGWYVRESDPRYTRDYKVLLANDGMHLYDASGAEVVKYGASIDLGSGRPFHIGSSQAYIEYVDTNSDGVADSIRIGGSNVTIGGTAPSSWLTPSDITVTQNQTSTGYDVDIAGNTFSLVNGADGTDGADGADGTSYYTYVRYSANSNGSSMTDTPSSSTKYIGVYTGAAAACPAYTAFTWCKFMGEDGTDGTNGTSVTVSSVKYATSSTESQPSDSSFTSNSVPSVSEGSWLWTMVTFSDGTKTYSKAKQGKAGTNGADGTTFTPSVDSSGNISWTNDGGKANPTSRNIKGPQGATGPEAVVTVYPSAIDWSAGTATLAVTLRVDGVITTPSTYKWTKGTSTTSLGTGSTLSVSDLTTVYHCTVTW